MSTKPKLTVNLLCKEANIFAQKESSHFEPALYGVTDGKAIGTYLEHKFQRFLREKYEYVEGSSAKGIDFPELEVDMKVTRITQPQSSCPFKSARQKIYGLGYSLLVFVYDKTDDSD
ncbi:MAG: restriction endonuclease, partial [Bacteroidetes bacterium]